MFSNQKRLVSDSPMCVFSWRNQSSSAFGYHMEESRDEQEIPIRRICLQILPETRE